MNGGYVLTGLSLPGGTGGGLNSSPPVCYILCVRVRFAGFPPSFFLGIEMHRCRSAYSMQFFSDATKARIRNPFVSRLCETNNIVEEHQRPNQGQSQGQSQGQGQGQGQGVGGEQLTRSLSLRNSRNLLCRP